MIAQKSEMKKVWLTTLTIVTYVERANTKNEACKLTKAIKAIEEIDIVFLYTVDRVFLFQPVEICLA